MARTSWAAELKKLEKKLQQSIFNVVCESGESSWALREKGIEDRAETRETHNSLEEAEKGMLGDEFPIGYGGTLGCFFTAWSDDYVFFPACYDGSEWVDYVPRNPVPNATEHIGGG